MLPILSKTQDGHLNKETQSSTHIHTHKHTYNSFIWKSGTSDKIKRDFFQDVAVSVILYGYTTLTNHIEKKTRWEQRNDAKCCFEQIFEAASHKATVVWPLTFHLSSHPCKTNKTCWSTGLGVGMNS